MPSFLKLFEDHNFAETIQYKGLTVGRRYLFDIRPNGRKFRIELVSTKSHLVQGIQIIPPSKKKGFKIWIKQLGRWFEDEIIRFWEETAPSVIEVEIVSPDEKVIISNCWLDESGKYLGYHAGGAMHWKTEGNSITFYCNDRELDDDFDDLIFQVTILD